jgi:glycosyltransferase involved in cell wall biosynthesis
MTGSSATAPLVSVVMPCFNAGPMLRPALLSVLNQTHPNLEVIFVDNNSTDDSAAVAAAIAAQSPRPIKLLHCPTQGANHARNLGYTAVGGDYVQWMDADDLLDPDKIALQVAALTQRPTFDIAYCDWSQRRVLADGGEPLVHRHPLAQVDDQILRTLATIWYPLHVYLIRRSAADRLQAAQAWWPKRRVTDDIEYSAIAALLGLRFLYVPGAHVHYNLWTQSQSSNSVQYPERAIVHRDMFARLKEVVAALGPALRLSAQHKLLLEQGWDVWTLRSLEIAKLPGRRFRLEHRETGKTMELRPREAQILAALRGRQSPRMLCLLAHDVARKAPELAKDHIAIVTTLQRVARAGFFERVHKVDT